jgi:hypothetical protein
MRKRTLAASISAIGAAGVVAVGTAVANAAPGTPTEYIRFLSSDATANPVAVANGPIHALGRDVPVTQHRDRIVFPDGNLIVRHSIVSEHNTSDRTTCYFRHTEAGTYTVLRGTGAYRNASGRGVYRLSAQAVGCSRTKPPRVFLLEIRAEGPLSI